MAAPIEVVAIGPAVEEETAATQVDEEVKRAADVALEAATIVEDGNKLFGKVWSDTQVERRSRKACIPISLPDTIIDKVLSRAQTSSSRLPKQASVESMSDLFASERLLREFGVPDELINDILINTARPSDPEKLLFYVIHEIQKSGLTVDCN